MLAFRHPLQLTKSRVFPLALKRHVDIPRRSIIMVIYPHEYIIIVTIAILPHL